MTHAEAVRILLSIDLPIARPKTELDIAADALEERVRAHMKRLCKHCRAPYEDHGNFTNGCPAPAHTKFCAMGCEACTSYGSFDAGQECGKECVAGTPFCAEHMTEAL